VRLVNIRDRARELRLSPSTRAAAERIKARMKASVLETGRDLIAVKEQLEHGAFQEWLECEFGLTPRTAQNYMQAARVFGAKSEIVSHLPQTLTHNPTLQTRAGNPPAALARAFRRPSIIATVLPFLLRRRNFVLRNAAPHRRRAAEDGRQGARNQCSVRTRWLAEGSPGTRLSASPERLRRRSAASCGGLVLLEGDMT
jgi:hypothetical protein